jgi:hypothetical protein
MAIIAEVFQLILRHIAGITGCAISMIERLARAANARSNGSKQLRMVLYHFHYVS